MGGIVKLVTFLALGELFVHLVGLPIPGPLLGLALMLGDFYARRRIDEDLAIIFDRVSPHFSVLFVPAGSGVLVYGSLLGDSLSIIAFSVLVGTIVTMLVTGWTLLLLLRLAARREGNCPQSIAGAGR